MEILIVSEQDDIILNRKPFQFSKVLDFIFILIEVENEPIVEGRNLNIDCTFFPCEFGVESNDWGVIKVLEGSVNILLRGEAIK